MSPQEHYIGPVSAKGIVFDDEAVWLRKNERNEWELPGGKVDRGEQPSETVARELREELGFEVEVLGIVDATLYQIHSSLDEARGVLVLSYLCRLQARTGPFELVGEAGPAEFQRFRLEEARSLAMPSFYKSAIAKAHREFLRGSG
jgi:8-oxo-dGTP pyrophosphatase MutT (NUDIX family)